MTFKSFKNKIRYSHIMTGKDFRLHFQAKLNFPVAKLKDHDHALTPGTNITNIGYKRYNDMNGASLVPVNKDKITLPAYYNDFQLFAPGKSQFSLKNFVNQHTAFQNVVNKHFTDIVVLRAGTVKLLYGVYHGDNNNMANTGIIPDVCPIAGYKSVIGIKGSIKKDPTDIHTALRQTQDFVNKFGNAGDHANGNQSMSYGKFYLDAKTPIANFPRMFYYKNVAYAIANDLPNHFYICNYEDLDRYNPNMYILMAMSSAWSFDIHIPEETMVRLIEEYKHIPTIVKALKFSLKDKFHLACFGEFKAAYEKILTYDENTLIAGLDTVSSIFGRHLPYGILPANDKFELHDKMLTTKVVYVPTTEYKSIFNPRNVIVLTDAGEKTMPIVTSDGILRGHYRLETAKLAVSMTLHDLMFARVIQEYLLGLIVAEKTSITVQFPLDINFRNSKTTVETLAQYQNFMRFVFNNTAFAKPTTTPSESTRKHLTAFILKANAEILATKNNTTG